MAVTVRGFDSPALQFSEATWASYQKRVSQSYNGMRVWSGGEVTPGTGRAVNVAVIDGIVPGVWFVSDAVTSVALAANAGTNRRIDYIVAEADWAANTVTIKPVAGVAAATPTPPALTQTDGVLWQMPLARVTVAGNASTIAATDVVAAAPKKVQPYPFTATPTVESMRGSATSWNTLATIPVPDPGWPYRVEVSATVRFNQTESAAYMRIRAIDADVGTEYAHGITSRLNSGKAPADMTSRASGILLGVHRVRLEMLPAEAAAGETLQVLDHQVNHFTVLQLPA